MIQEDALLLQPDATNLDKYRHALKFNAYWESLRSERHIPLRSSFRPQSVSPLLPFIILLGKDIPTNSFTFRIVGTAIENLLPDIKSGDDVSVMEPYDTNNTIKAMADKTLRLEKPHFFESSLSSKANLPVPDYGMVMVPFSSDGTMCDLVMALFDFKSSIKDPS